VKTVNEQFRDILLRRQMALASFERGLTADVLDVLDKTEKDLRVTLIDRLADIEGKDIAGKTTTSRLNVLANTVGKLRRDSFEEMGSLWDESMKELAQAEAGYLDDHLKHISPVQLDTVLPDPVALAAMVATQPLQGRILSDWASGLGDLDAQRIMDAVRIGVAQGETTDNIVRRVLGTRSLDGSDGVLQMTRNDIASITQTAVSTYSNEARQAYYEANEDIFSKEEWVATLDDATCEECGDLDGEEFDIGEGEQPPLHFNCRCVRVPVIDGGAIGDRPANAAFEDELDGLNKEDRAARVQELVGQVPQSVKYSDWLADQTTAFQDHVLGPTRGALFRDGGLELSRFINTRGDRLNLDQLRRLEPAAFRKAGL
jgi:SPP1 gp7 family putative phage head morphogenesis protein